MSYVSSWAQSPPWPRRSSLDAEEQLVLKLLVDEGFAAMRKEMQEILCAMVDEVWTQFGEKLASQRRVTQEEFRLIREEMQAQAGGDFSSQRRALPELYGVDARCKRIQNTPLAAAGSTVPQSARQWLGPSPSDAGSGGQEPTAGRATEAPPGGEGAEQVEPAGEHEQRASSTSSISSRSAYPWWATRAPPPAAAGSGMLDPGVLHLQGAQSLADADGGKAASGRRWQGRPSPSPLVEASPCGGGSMGSGAGVEVAAPPAKAPQAKPGLRNHGQEEEEEEYTTVMMRNIPNKYTREMLIKQLSVGFGGEFDFMYLPIDFSHKCNVGYSFVNFRNKAACERFVSQFNGVDVRNCLPGVNSKKVVEITPARVQGLQENITRLRNSPVMNQLQDHPEWMPLIFNEDGEEVPFPNPDQPLPPVKSRCRIRDTKASTDAG